MTRIGIIGVGKLGKIITDSILKNTKYDVVLCVKDRSAYHVMDRYYLNKDRISVIPHVEQIGVTCDKIIISVKSYDIYDICNKLSSFQDTTIISCTTGVPLKQLQKWLPDSNIIRIIPNLTMNRTQTTIPYFDDFKNLKYEIKDLFGKNKLLPLMSDCNMDSMVYLY